MVNRTVGILLNAVTCSNTVLVLANGEWHLWPLQHARHRRLVTIFEELFLWYGTFGVIALTNT